MILQTNIYNISSKDLVNKIISLGKKAEYLPNFEECINYLNKNVHDNDIILTLGAGTVTEIGDLLLNFEN